MPEITPAYLGEVLLLRWGDSHSNGRTVTFQLDEHVGEQHPFKGLKCGPNGQRLQVCAVLIDENEQPQNPKKPIGPDSPPPGQVPHSAVEGQAKPRTPFREMPRSQQAALKCRDGSFRSWLCDEYGRFFREVTFFKGEEPEQIGDRLLKEMLGITSKKELDTDPFKAAEWDKLITSYDLRNTVR